MWDKLLDRRIGFQLGLLQTLLQIGIAVCLALTVGYLARRHTLELEIEGLHGRNKTAIAAFTSYERSLTPLVNTRMGMLKDALRGKIALQAPGELSFDGKPGAPAFSATVSALTAQVGNPATVFARKGEEFVRVASSLKKEDGGSVAGTSLEHKNPAYAALLKGQGYIGLVRNFGKPYLARYEPIADGGAVIGALAVMRSLEIEFSSLGAGMSAVKIGDSGYVYVLDRNGVSLVHPKLVGYDFWNVKDADGRPFIQEMLAAKEGVRYYPWANPGEKAPRDKIVAFDTYEPWGLLIGSGAYTDELTMNVNALVAALLLACLVALVVQVALMQYVTNNTVAKPIARLALGMNQVATGDLTVSFGSYPNTNSEVRQIEHGAGKAVGFMHDVVVSARESASSVEASAQNLSRAVAEGSKASLTQSQ